MKASFPSDSKTRYAARNKETTRPEYFLSLEGIIFIARLIWVPIIRKAPTTLSPLKFASDSMIQVYIPTVFARKQNRPA